MSKAPVRYKIKNYKRFRSQTIGRIFSKIAIDGEIKASKERQKHDAGPTPFLEKLEGN